MQIYFRKIFVKIMENIEFKRFRKVTNLEQQELADYLSVTRAQISMIERGKSKLTKENLRKLINNPYGWDVSMLPRDPLAITSSVIIGGDSTNSTINQDNRQYYSDSPDVLRAQIEILDERIKEKDAQIKEKDAQIKQLLDILSKK